MSMERPVWPGLSHPTVGQSSQGMPVLESKVHRRGSRLRFPPRVGLQAKFVASWPKCEGVLARGNCPLPYDGACWLVPCAWGNSSGCQISRLNASRCKGRRGDTGAWRWAPRAALCQSCPMSLEPNPMICVIQEQSIL